MASAADPRARDASPEKNGEQRPDARAPREDGGPGAAVSELASRTAAPGAARTFDGAQGTGDRQVRPAARDSGESPEVQAAGTLPGWREYAAQNAPAGPATVREAARTAMARAEQEVVRRASLIQGNGTSEVSLRLQPPELGRMDVRIRMRNGQLDVRIQVENPQVRESVQADLQNLGRALRDAQLSPTNLEVSQYQTGRQGAWEEHLPGGSAGQAPAGAGDAGDEAAGEAGTALRDWAVFTDGGVDCLI